MSKRKDIILATAGILTGLALGGPVAHAATTALTATPSTQNFYVDGQKEEFTAYVINGNNYVKVRDIGQAVDFGVTYDSATNSVYIDPDAHYETEQPSAPSGSQSGTVTLPTDGSRYEPKAGDKIACNDGTVYTITDVSRWDKNMFASGPAGDLPEPTCDWSLLPQPELPDAEARHFTLETGDYLFVRNLYETRRMLYTLYNAIGNNPGVWKNGVLVDHPNGGPLIRISLTIPDDREPHVFWPWKDGQLEKIYKSCPYGLYSMQVWDVYCDGIFLRTEYKIALN